MSSICPTSSVGKHTFAGNYASNIYKTDFEPVEIGVSASKTLYRRVEWMISTCSCGESRKLKVIQEEDV